MKKILGIAMVLMIAFTVNAQTSNTEKSQKNHNRNHNNREAFSNIDLSASQKEEMQKINKDFQAEMKSLKSNSQLTDAQKKEQRIQLLSRRKEAVNKILTPEQKQKWEASKSTHERGKKEFSKTAQGKNDHMKDLNLSQEQVAKIKTINASYQDKISLLKNHRKEERTEQKQAFAKLRKQQHDEIKAVLTPEQIEKFESKKMNRRIK
ncbi:MAG TPA: hypothetical protein VM012_10460 [Flavitalea sp.]|nr:hypothetical protein [Flavitalea sp.]